MSNKTRLQTNNTNLQALIDKANTLPDAGSGSGGGSVETCTVTITTSAASATSISSVYATVLEGSLLTLKYFYPKSTDYGNSLVVENIVCNTQVFLSYSSMMGAGNCSIEGGELILRCSQPTKGILVVPTEENVSINIA